MSLKDLVIVQPKEVKEAARLLRESAQQIDNDGTPSQAGMTPDEARAMAAMLDRLSAEMGITTDLRKALRTEIRRANSAERNLQAAYKYLVPKP